MTKPKRNARTHHKFDGDSATFVVRYDIKLLQEIKAMANEGNESINKTINDLCQAALELRRNQKNVRKLHTRIS